MCAAQAQTRQQAQNKQDAPTSTATSAPPRVAAASAGGAVAGATAPAAARTSPAPANWAGFAAAQSDSQETTPADFDPLLPANTPAKQRSAIASQLSALLDARRALDANGGAGLKTWTAERGRGAGFCQGGFEGVTCDPYGNVVGVVLNSLPAPLGGTLPPAHVLMRLPKLRTLDVARADLRGTLPAGYGDHEALEELTVAGNPGLKGPLPREWAGLKNLRKLYLL